jgi:uncharacterized SAM-binding protein YcdF (DUF218 family)
MVPFSSPTRGEMARWMGTDTSRITFVRESRNTLEDALNAKAIVHPTPGEVWILVTSAFHMPRSVGLFRAQGWRVVADPWTIAPASVPARLPLPRLHVEPHLAVGCSEGMDRDVHQLAARAQ